MLSTCLALALAIADPAPAQLVLGPAAQGRAVVVDERGDVVAHVVLVPGRSTRLGLPPGRYRIESEGERIAEVELGAGETFILDSPPRLAAEVPLRPTPIASTPSTAVVAPAMDDDEAPRKGKRRSGKWKRWGAPLFSAIVPGAGQVLTQRPGRGMVYFASTVGLGLGAWAVWRTADPTEGATRGADDTPRSAEIVRNGAVAAMTGAAALLYLGQILDAHGGAVGKLGAGVDPYDEHILSFEVQRSSTVGFSAGQPETQHYPDYSIAVMGQAVDKFSIGAGDLSLKREPARGGVTVQGGVRAAYRFWAWRRLWLSAGGGVVLQGTNAQRDAVSIDPVPGAGSDESRFGAFMYAMLDSRIFVLDHWALMVVPRLSVPFTERRFGLGRTLPRFATTFELALGGAVHF